MARRHKLHHLEQPSQSPDLNPVEVYAENQEIANSSITFSCACLYAENIVHKGFAKKLSHLQPKGIQLPMSETLDRSGK